MKTKTIFVCSNCGVTSPQWKGRCTSCEAWNTFVEEVIADKKQATVVSGARLKPDELLISLDEVSAEEAMRKQTPDSELNRVLGGGIVPGSVILLGGEPGIGKSTILLQMALEATDLKIMYVAGEESVHQIKLRANRLGRLNPNCYLFAETVNEDIISAAKKLQPDVLIVDSIQTVSSAGIDAAPGSIVQIRECAHDLIRFAKKSGSATFLVGHITKEGQIAGPKILEHMVDTVLYFEGDRHYNYRILRSMKNRFGSAAEIGIYEMSDKGLRPINNPSEILLQLRDEPLSGISIAATLEGIRPMLVEVQALVSPSPYGTPQRSTTGYDPKRMSMLLAVLEKRCGLRINMFDVFLNIAGGLKVDDPAIDLAVAMAMASSFQDFALPLEACFAGEVGLSGEIRPVQQIEKRVSEAEKLGFRQFYLSGFNKKAITRKFQDIELVYVDTLDKLLARVF